MYLTPRPAVGKFPYTSIAHSHLGWDGRGFLSAVIYALFGCLTLWNVSQQTISLRSLLLRFITWNDWFIWWLHLSTRRSPKLVQYLRIQLPFLRGTQVAEASNRNNVLYPYKTIHHFLTCISVTSECPEILSVSFSLTIVGLFARGMLDLVGPYTQNFLCQAF